MKLKLHGTCPQLQRQAFSHPSHRDSGKVKERKGAKYESCYFGRKGLLAYKSPFKVHTLLMSVNSLNNSMLVIHASSCSYPNPVTRRDCSTCKQVFPCKMSKHLAFENHKHIDSGNPHIKRYIFQKTMKVIG